MTRVLTFLFIAMAAKAAVAPQLGDVTHVRHIFLKKDQIVAVKTSVGIATLIQVPDRPTSAIIGDTEAFKLEYLDNGVTIKPLHGGARTNLYIYTDSQRFSIHLVPAPKELADYIVYLKSASTPPKPEGKVQWKQYLRTTQAGAFTLKIIKLGLQAGGILFVNFEIKAAKDFPIKPDWFWVTQDGKYKPIQSLYLSRLSASPPLPTSGTLILKESDFAGTSPLKLEMRSQRPLSILLPGVKKWLK